MILAAVTSEGMISDTGRRCSRVIPLLITLLLLGLECWCPGVTEWGLGCWLLILGDLEWPTSDEARLGDET